MITPTRPAPAGPDEGVRGGVAPPAKSELFFGGGCRVEGRGGGGGRKKHNYLVMFVAGANGREMKGNEKKLSPQIGTSLKI